MKKLVAVYGPGDRDEDDASFDEARRFGKLLAEARRFGKLLAEAGFNLVTGGYGGVMEAASRGANEAGGGVLAITAEVYSARGIQTNEYITKEIKVKSAVDRLMELIDLPDAAVTFGANPGTLVEVMMLCDYMTKGFLQSKPMIVVGSEWKTLLTAFESSAGLKNANNQITFAVDADDAISKLTKHFGPQQLLPELTVLKS